MLLDVLAFWRAHEDSEPLRDRRPRIPSHKRSSVTAEIVTAMEESTSMERRRRQG